MRSGSTHTAASTPALPPASWKVRVKRILRGLKRLARRRTVTQWARSDERRTIRGDDGHIEIVVSDAGELAALLTSPTAAGSAREVRVRVEAWSPAWPGWSGRLGPLSGVTDHKLSLPLSGIGPADVSVALAAPVEVRRVIVAVIPVLLPRRATLPRALSANVAIFGATPAWLAAEQPMPAETPARDSVPAYDMVVIADGAASPAGTPTSMIATATSVRGKGGDHTILADARDANPCGRQDYSPDLAAAELRVISDGGAALWRLHDTRAARRLLAEGRVGAPLTGRHRGALNKIRSATFAASPHASLRDQAHALAQLAMTGIALHTDADASALLAPELATHLAAPLPAPGADVMEWELRSIRQRRSALRSHGSGLRFAQVADAVAPATAVPSVSALLVTRRPDAVLAAAEAIAAQTYPDLEIVVGLHGIEIASGVSDRLRRLPKPVTVVPIDGRITLGEALAAATRAASGSLVTKMDDDDRYGREHVWDLVLARHFSGADVVGKGAEFVYVGPYDTTVRRRMGSELYSDVVAGGTIMIARGDLEQVGGWRPLPRAVDRTLLDRVLADGGLVYRTHNAGFVYVRNASGHTWDPGIDYFVYDPRAQWRGPRPPYSEFDGP